MAIAQIESTSAARDGALHVVHGDGSEVVIPKEKGRFAVGGQAVEQSEFSGIQRADDRWRIGWLPIP